LPQADVFLLQEEGAYQNPKGVTCVKTHKRTIMKKSLYWFSALALIVVIPSAYAYHTSNLTELLLYFIVVGAAFAVSQLFPEVQKNPVVNKPAAELWVVLITIALSAGLSVFRFMYKPDMATMPLVPKLILLLLVAGGVFALAPFIYFKFFKKYTLEELGWRITGVPAATLIVLLFGISAWLFRPEAMQFSYILENEGWYAFITLGLFTAALPEETMRFYTQTRIEATSGSFVAAWFGSALLWALLHFPVFVSQSGNPVNAFMSVLALLPLGLLWGYLTKRFQSVIPAIVVHATNLWGLQNVFN
jgi:hypothetical protein